VPTPGLRGYGHNCPLWVPPGPNRTGDARVRVAGDGCTAPQRSVRSASNLHELEMGMAADLLRGA